MHSPKTELWTGSRENVGSEEKRSYEEGGQRSCLDPFRDPRKILQRSFVSDPFQGLPAIPSVIRKSVWCRYGKLFKGWDLSLGLRF